MTTSYRAAIAAALVSVGITSAADAAVILGLEADTSWPASPSVQAATPSQAGVGQGFGSGAVLAQTFPVAADVQVGSIFIEFSSGSAVANTSFTYRVLDVADNSTAPPATGGTVLASGTLTLPATIPSGATLVKISFSGSDSFTMAGKNSGGYAFQLIDTNADATSPFSWTRTGSNLSIPGSAHGTVGSRDYSLAITAIPEPASLSLLGLVALRALSRRRRV